MILDMEDGGPPPPPPPAGPARAPHIYLTVLCGHIPTLFPYFLVFRYPYILLHF